MTVMIATPCSYKATPYGAGLRVRVNGKTVSIGERLDIMDNLSLFEDSYFKLVTMFNGKPKGWLGNVAGICWGYNEQQQA